jgi:glycosyltransferase involved in cell wall biosynthesis
MMGNFVWALQQAQGKYIALCEGDDYWTDPLKLQKQVDFLEANPDFALCASLATRTYDDGLTANDIEGEAGIFTQEDLAHRNFIPTASTLFKKEYVLNYPDWASKCAIGDWPLFLICSNYGKIKVLNEQMVVRRVHASGIWGANLNNQNRVNNIRRLKETFAILKDKFSETTNHILNNNYLKQVVILTQIHLKQENYIEVNKHLQHLLETGINLEEDRVAIVNTITDKMLQLGTENKTLKSLNLSLMTSTSYKLGRKFTGLFKFMKSREK